MWYCTCEKVVNKKVVYDHKKLCLTKVNSEEECIYCGHYAVKLNDKYNTLHGLINEEVTNKIYLESYPIHLENHPICNNFYDKV